MLVPENNRPRGGSDGFDDALGYKITHPDGYLKNYTFVKLDYNDLFSNCIFVLVVDCVSIMATYVWFQVGYTQYYLKHH